jgi:hypothetical protein
VEDVDFSDAFCRFVQTHLPSVEAAELLLHVRRTPGVPPPPHRDTAKYLQAFRAAGLLDEGSEELKAHLATLAKAYEERPVTLVRLIYALHDRKIRSFADAFKLRKD